MVADRFTAVKLFSVTAVSVALAKLLLAELGTSVISHVLQMGSARNDSHVRPTPSDLAAVDTSEVRCFDSAAGERMITEIKEAAVRAIMADDNQYAKTSAPTPNAQPVMRWKIERTIVICHRYT